MKHTKIKEAIFWSRKGMDVYDISLRVHISMDAVRSALWGYKTKYPRLVAKFARWNAIRGSAVGKYQQTEFCKENDLSFPECLKVAGVDNRRIELCGRNYMAGVNFVKKNPPQIRLG